MSLLAVVLVGLGIAIVVQTATGTNAPARYAMGALFVALGLGRLYLLRRR